MAFIVHCLEECKLIEIRCNHKFCENCITEWSNKNNSCPICRSPINLVNQKISEDINTDRLNQVIRRFPSELYIYGMKVTPSKYLGSFFGSCINGCHSIVIDKPYGVVLTCNTCNKRKGYNWIN